MEYPHPAISGLI